MDILQKNRKLLIFEGIIFTLLGCLAVALPVISTLSIEMFIGALFIFGGIFQALRSFKTQQSQGFLGSFLISLVYIVFGCLLLFYPLAGVISLTIMLMFFFIVEGISKIFLAFQMRPLKQWLWFLMSGVISLIMAFIIFSGWPGTAFWVLGLLVGINMIFFGISLFFFGLSLPKSSS